MAGLRQLNSIFFLMLLIAGISAALGRNSIEGRVVGTNGRGIEDVRVQLKNQNFTDIGQDITDSLGSYRFQGVSDGVYYIEVVPAGSLFQGRTLRVQLASLSQRPGGSADIYRFDFELLPLQPIERPLPKKLAESLLFAQEVPPTALQKYKDAQKLLAKDKKEEAYALLRDAIEIFPDYYDALDALGTAYLAERQFRVAVPIFLQAVDVNPKGWHAYNGLGYAYSNLAMRKQSIDALKKAIDLNPFHARAHVNLGTELAKDKQSVEDAIKAFQKAVELEPIIAAEAYIALASIYSGLGRNVEAADALSKYLEVGQDIKNPDSIKAKIRELKNKAP
jgi:tetratricopeptide (TPR) repeat protein